MAVHFVDEARIFVKPGDGGRGCVSFTVRSGRRRPNGGPGGSGGGIVFIGRSNLSTLADFRFQQHYYAKNGTHGSSNNKNGRDAQDCVLQVPLGTKIRTEQGGELEIHVADEPVVFRPGGKGGRGNNGLPNPHIVVNHAGEVCEGEWITLELQLLADVGVVGFPNAGKSSFVGAISGARPKVGAYPFTTLVPVLGVVEVGDLFNERSFKIADLPGLIRGAHEGAGLGTRFLRHLSRVRCLVHMVDVTGSDPKPRETYDIVCQELLNHDTTSLNRPRLVLLNKTELLDADELSQILRQFADVGVEVLPISVHQKTGLEQAKEAIAKLLFSNENR